ncbi:radical SAM protein [Halobacteriovorax sp. HLS]|uniref:radical SAM protein n=1 Tax=Halobacteriovorax sp. HLS TaxID=2234000 RepID=UPI000FDA6695|nr:radical SAM protein [Halobacteriovorax sp. HLS]
MFKKLKNKIMNPLFFFLNETYSSLSELFSFIIPQTPLVLKVRITSKCNLSCPFCYLKIGLNQKEDGHLTLEEWEKILTNLPKRTVVDITGAEPVAYHNLIPFIELLNRLKFKYSITTNGTLYNDATADSLVKNNLSVLMVSLDGMKDTHNRLRGSDKAFDRTIEFIRRIEAAKKKFNSKYPVISIKATVLDENYSELNDLVDFCNENFELDVFGLTLLFQNRARGGMELVDEFGASEFSSGNTAVFKEREKVIKSLEQIIKRRSSLPFPVVIKPRMSIKSVYKYINDPSSMDVKSCPQYKNNLTLYYNGEISPCDIGLNIGNIRELNYRFPEVYKGPRFLKFKSLMSKSHKSCQGCCAGKHS